MSSKFTINLTEIPAYYINLDKDEEKRESIEYSLKSLGFKSINRFAGFQEDVKRVGVAKSHKALLSELSDSPTPFVIFEDDIQIGQFVDQIQVPSDADAFYLGNSIFGLYDGRGQRKVSVSRIDREIFKLHNMLAAHAIVYFNSEYVNFLIKAIEFNLSIKTNQDKARAETMKYWNIYGYYNPMFYQPGKHEPFTRVALPNKFCVGPEKAF